MTITIRPYRPTDHGACRALWGELTERHRELYDDPAIGGADPGAAFEEYLTRLDLSGMWVADDSERGVVGFVGLVLRGRSGEVEPVAVAATHRGDGVDTALLGRVSDEARKRGLASLTVTPVSRDADAIRGLHGAGYTALSNITLTLDLKPRGHQWRDGVDVHGLRFKY